MWTDGKSHGREAPIASRREFLERTGSGFGMLALSWLLNRDSALGATAPTAYQNPLAAKPPPFAGEAKSVIYLFMHGGPSHVDTFDPKPALAKFDGHPAP